jgi:hypothetical protein
MSMYWPREQAGAEKDGVSFMKAVKGYRAKGFECLLLAECMNDAEERAEMLRFARIWMNLAKPVEELRGAYELPPADEERRNHSMAMLSNFAASRLVGEITPLLGDFQPSILVVWAFD